MVKYEDLEVNEKLWRAISRCSRLSASLDKDRVVKNGDIHRKYLRQRDIHVHKLAAMGLHGTAFEICELHKSVKEIRSSKDETMESLNTVLGGIDNG